MTKTTMDLTELLQKHDQGDLLRSIAEAVLQLMMESDVDGLIGAGRHERAEQRTIWRNGCPPKLNESGRTGLSAALINAAAGRGHLIFTV